MARLISRVEARGSALALRGFRVEEKDGRSFVIHEAESFWGYVDRCESGQTDMRASDRASRSSKDPTWCGTKSFEEAVRLARAGWPEGLDRIGRISNRVYSSLAHNIELPLPYYEVEGGSVDIARFLTGEPECMLTMDADNALMGTGRRLLRIVCNICQSCGVTVESMFHRGAAVVALVDLLDRVGFRSEVVLCSGIAPSSDDGGDRLELYVPVKRAEQPLDLPILAFAMAHASMLRRLEFSSMEQLPSDWRDVFGVYDGAGYGMPADVRQRGDIYLGTKPRGEDPNWTFTKCITWVTGELRKVGIEVADDP